MIGTVPLAFIGAHVRHTLVIHAHTHRGGGEGGRLCHKKCPCQGKLLVPSVDRILTLLLLVRVTVTVTVGQEQALQPVCCLFVWLICCCLFWFPVQILQRWRSTASARRRVPAAFDFYIDCVVPVPAGGPWVCQPPPPLCMPRHFLFLFVWVYMCVSVCVWMLVCVPV